MLLLSLLQVASRAQRVATPHEVQPGPRDVVHAVWPFGPTNTEKLGGGWPSFASSAGSGDASAQCTVVDDGFTGYNANGAYYQKSSGELDSKAQLMIYSGRLGIVVDVGGLKADASTKSRNLFPRVGTLSTVPDTPAKGYALLPEIATDITLKTTCGSEVKTYVLGTPGNRFVQVGLVRHGHTRTGAGSWDH